MNTMEIVDKIPIKQSSSATPQIKKYLLDKVREIRHNRSIIEGAAQRQKKNEILDAYKKNVGYDKIEARLKKISLEIDELREKALNLGIDPDCHNLITLHEDQVSKYVSGKTVFFNSEQRDKIKKVQELLAAVEKEVGIFAPMDILETRMMLASTVGEAMAIVNAVAGIDVFKIDLGQLKLEEKKEPDQQPSARK